MPPKSKSTSTSKRTSGPAPMTGKKLLKSRLLDPARSSVEKLIHPANTKYYAMAAIDISITDTQRDAPSIFAEITKEALTKVMKDKAMAEILKQVFVPLEREQSHVLDTEGDVERVTHLYLLHETNQMMEAYVATALPGHRLLCRSQVTQDRARTDIVWTARHISNEEDEITIFVLELKRCNVIKRKEWSAQVIKLPQDSTREERRDAISKEGQSKIEKAFDQGSTKAAQPNRIPLSHQAVKYVISHGAPVVLLFDWESMILLNFKPNGETFDDDSNPAGFFFAKDEKGTCHFRTLLIAAFLMGLKSGPVEKRGEESE
ncbi:hypothetical protein C8R47DRAFT_1285108 [Mycena vitilis]|nr:hypothetical protein C8R47DRAFT_1285108 [Mycena vitilis]